MGAPVFIKMPLLFSFIDNSNSFIIIIRNQFGKGVVQMDLLNKNVEHKTYGVGVITKYDEKSKTVFIEFTETGVTKMFSYPDSFK